MVVMKCSRKALKRMMWLSTRTAMLWEDECAMPSEDGLARGRSCSEVGQDVQLTSARPPRRAERRATDIAGRGRI